MKENEIPTIYLKLRIFHWRILSLAQSQQVWWYMVTWNSFNLGIVAIRWIYKMPRSIEKT